MQPQPDNSLIPFAFEGMAIRESCWLDGKPYFTRRAIGEFLEYPHPRQAVEKIIKRNPHISDPRWSRTVPNLGTVEGGREVARDLEVYDPIGFQLIIFESRQPKAKAYKIAAAHLVYAYMRGELVPSLWSRKGDRVAPIKQLLSAPPSYERRKVVMDIAQREGKCPNTIYLWVEKSGYRLLTKAGNPRKRRSDSGPARKAEAAKILEYKAQHPKAYGAEIKKATGVSYAVTSINRILIDHFKKT